MPERTLKAGETVVLRGGPKCGERWVLPYPEQAASDFLVLFTYKFVGDVDEQGRPILEYFGKA